MHHHAQRARTKSHQGICAERNGPPVGSPPPWSPLRACGLGLETFRTSRISRLGQRERRSTNANSLVVHTLRTTVYCDSWDARFHSHHHFRRAATPAYRLCANFSSRCGKTQGDWDRRPTPAEGMLPSPPPSMHRWRQPLTGGHSGASSGTAQPGFPGGGKRPCGAASWARQKSRFSFGSCGNDENRRIP